jgi:hypothetical protein
MQANETIELRRGKTMFDRSEQPMFDTVQRLISDKESFHERFRGKMSLMGLDGHIGVVKKQSIPIDKESISRENPYRHSGLTESLKYSSRTEARVNSRNIESLYQVKSAQKPAPCRLHLRNPTNSFYESPIKPGPS